MLCLKIKLLFFFKDFKRKGSKFFGSFKICFICDFLIFKILKVVLKLVFFKLVILVGVKFKDKINKVIKWLFG